MNCSYYGNEDGGNFHAVTQDLGNGGKNYIFVSNELMAAAGESEEMQVDGTFKAVPHLFQQLLSMHMVSFDHVSNYAMNNNYIKVWMLYQVNIILNFVLQFVIYYEYSPRRSADESIVILLVTVFTVPLHDTVLQWHCTLQCYSDTARHSVVVTLLAHCI